MQVAEVNWPDGLYVTQSTLRCKRGWNESQPCTFFARTRLISSTMYMYKNLAPMPGHPLMNGNKRKTALSRKHNCCPCALEVTNLNAVASNLPRTCFKSQSLPNSVICITELHLHVFLALCSSSNSGKSLWTWRNTSESRSIRSSLDHKNYILNCRD